MPAQQAARTMALEALGAIRETLEHASGHLDPRLIAAQVQQVDALLQVHKGQLKGKPSRRQRRIFEVLSADLHAYVVLSSAADLAQAVLKRRRVPDHAEWLAQHLETKRVAAWQVLETEKIAALALDLSELEEAFDHMRLEIRVSRSARPDSFGQAMATWFGAELSRIRSILNKSAPTILSKDGLRLRRFRAALRSWGEVGEPAAQLLAAQEPLENLVQELLPRHLILDTLEEAEISEDQRRELIGFWRSDLAYLFVRDSQRMFDVDAFVEAGKRLEKLFAKDGQGHLNLERCFLLNDVPRLCAETRIEEIYLGWIPGNQLREGVRRVYGDTGLRHYRQVSFGQGAQNYELEEETSEEVFESLWALTAGRRVRKRRYNIREGASSWEIDEFHDRDLVLARVKGRRGQVRGELPQWLKPHVDREVTGDATFLGRRLGR